MSNFFAAHRSTGGTGGQITLPIRRNMFSGVMPPGESSQMSSSSGSLFSSGGTQNSQSSEQREDEDVNPCINEIVMSVCVAVGNIGAAYYEPRYGHIYIFEDVVESYDTCDVLKTLIEYVRPNIVLTSAKQDEKVMYHLKNLCRAPATDPAANNVPDLDADTSPNKPLLKLLRAWDFGYTSCKQRIYTVIGNSTTEGTSHSAKRKGSAETESHLRAQFAINFEASCMVRAFGALLKYLNLRRIGKAHTLLHGSTVSGSSSSSASTSHARNEHEEDQRTDGIYCLKKLILERTVSIDLESLDALQVFQQQYHPSVYKAGRAGTKEGSSLFSMCNHCQSGPGAVELRRWFLRPLSDIEKLKERLDTVEYLADDGNSEIMMSMSRTLRQMHHITSILHRMQLSKTSCRDWISLFKTLTSCCRLRELILITNPRPSLLTELASTVREEVFHVCSLLREIVDFEASRREGRFIVKPGVDEELDARKHFLAHLPEFLSYSARNDVDALDIGVEGCGVTYVPLLGFLLTVPLSGDETNDAALLENVEMEVVFIADQVAHCKCDFIRQMDNEFGDVKFKIIDYETAIMLQVQAKIVEHASFLLDAVQNAAQVDCLISMAVSARRYGWTKPRLLEENTINIECGRHPIQEFFSLRNQFVPNSTNSGGMHEKPADIESDGASQMIDDEDLTIIRAEAPVILTQTPKVHMITGPNASGKSVYLKQVGLLAYMAHVGCFVPAVKAEIGVLDAIFTRLRTMDSVAGELSSFATDLRQVSQAVKYATGRSLILIDEFGKGTDMDVAAGLLTSIMEHWMSKENDQCPHVFVSSHLYSILNLLPQSPLLEYQTMNISTNEQGRLVFLYKLVNGSVNSSLAMHVAQEVGLQTRVVRRALDVFGSIRQGIPIRRKDMSEDDYQKTMQKMNRLVNRFLATNLCDTRISLKDRVERFVREEIEGRRRVDDSDVTMPVGYTSN